MLLDHRYSHAEAAAVAGLSEAEVRERAAALKSITHPPGQARVRPYPGGRQTRTGLRLNRDPLRGTKVSLFVPWDPASYLVLDLPEAITSREGIHFQAHTFEPAFTHEAEHLGRIPAVPSAAAE